MVHHETRHGLLYGAQLWQRRHFVHRSTHKANDSMVYAMLPHDAFRGKCHGMAPWYMRNGTFHETKPSMGYAMIDIHGDVRGTLHHHFHFPA